MLGRVAVLAVVLAGCAAPAGTTSPYAVLWQENGHLVLTITNTGAEPLRIDAILATLRATGPDGPVPMFWAGRDGATALCAIGEATANVPAGDVRCASAGLDRMPAHGAPLAPGAIAAYRFHALTYDDGTWGLMLTPDASIISDEMAMHKAGTHLDMPPGEYVFLIGGHRVVAPLS